MKTHKNIIVTLMHNKWELTSSLLRDLYQYEYGSVDRVIVVDNGSTENFNLGKESWSNRNLGLDITFLRIEENIGFTLGANYGLIEADKISDNSLIFLISNDVRIHSSFIRQAEELLLGKRALLGNRHIVWDTGWNTFKGKTFDYLEGYFLATTKQGWDELDYFDSNYAPCDMEDVDLSTKARLVGYKLVSLNNPNIIHIGAATYGYTEEREAITVRNKKYFQQKWAPE